MLSARRTIVCLFIIIAVAVCGYSQSAPSDGPTATITGKVTLQGDAVQGVIITLFSTESGYRKLMNQRGVTGANGEYRITNVPPGNYIVVPSAGAFVPAGESNADRTVIVNKAETIENFDFSLVQGSVITGRVVDPDGRPIIEEEIQIYPAQQPHSYSPYPAAVTDDRGVYRIFGLKAGSYKVAAGRESSGRSHRQQHGVHSRTFYPSVSDFAQATVIQVTEGSEATNIDITLSRLLTTYTASGRIMDGGTGQPLAKVNFGLWHFIDSTSSTRVNSAGVTNERGEFKLEGLPPGQYALVVTQRPGSYFRSEEVRFEIVDHDVAGLVIKTSKGASMSGVLVLEGTYNKEIREQFLKTKVFAMVDTEVTKKTGVFGVEAEMGPNGSFRVGGLPAGIATFSFAGPPRFTIVRVEQNGIVQPVGLELKQGEDVAGLKVVVGYGDASLRGTVELENGPMPPDGRLSVWAIRINEGRSRTGPGAQIDARGEFVFESLLPGTYEVTAAVFVPGSRRTLAQKREQVVVLSGTTSRITIKLDLNAAKSNP